jgi:predicted transglutaminase-like cysteine proteinase
VATEPSLREKFASFRRAQQRRQAQEVAAWIQENARSHYRPDGAFDHWATLEETLAADGDDCDGLELLPFNLLRELGFPQEEVFRAIVYRSSDDQHHMVTLWFESPDDPWVIDPTGAMTRGMPRLSEVAGWVALRVFDDARRFTPRAVAAQ